MNEDVKTTVVVDYDNPEDIEVMKISLPLKHFANNQIGTVLIKGFLDDIKEIALKDMRNIQRKMAAKTQIITPGVKLEVK